MKILSKGSTVYLARIHHATGIYEVCELHIRTMYPDAFVGVDTHTKQAFYLDMEDCDVYIFDDRDEALRIVKAAEKNKKELTTISEGEDD